MRQRDGERDEADTKKRVEDEVIIDKIKGQMEPSHK